jgi:hypothetical protein
MKRNFTSKKVSRNGIEDRFSISNRRNVLRNVIMLSGVFCYLSILAFVMKISIIVLILLSRIELCIKVTNNREFIM